ncbi:MAG TPA: sigma-70 family RNA polymerase sigma factor [Pirellulales bacterium]|jgi:RNA polymerase sigma-70 factor (ECF subfamily)|nr:sigma-70 family RNA polymerase sigma factor [Pirellulales bacterium]
MENAEQVTVEELLARAREGDQGERDRLFEACRGYLALVARTQVESWLQAKADASDLVQQTLLEAHRGFDRFEGKTEAEWLAWLRRILSHNAADLVRRYRGTSKRQARREIPLRRPSDDSQAGGAPEPASRELSPSQQLIAHDRDLQIAAALDRLAPDHREVIVLRNLERLPFDVVAERMGRSRPAVQMLWARAIKKLQETVQL